MLQVPDWDIATFEGSMTEIRWNLKDLMGMGDVLSHCAHKRVALQAGGCLGIFPKYLSQIFDVVYTFEPDPKNFEALCNNAHELNIVKLQAALGRDRNLIKTVCTLPDGKKELHEGMTHVEAGGTIPTMRIDDLNLPICDLIYLDIEGYEMFALQGAIETVKRCKPVIVCEINNSLRQFELSPDDIYTWLRMRNYKQVSRHRSDEVFIHE